MRRLLELITAKDAAFVSTLAGLNGDELAKIETAAGEPLPKILREILAICGKSQGAIKLHRRDVEVELGFKPMLQRLRKAPLFAEFSDVPTRRYGFLARNPRGNDNGHVYLDLAATPLPAYFPVVEVNETFGVEPERDSVYEFFFGRLFPDEVRRRLRELREAT